jgi:monofunctional biosynthetic peptidoglycan transglycosylase
LGNFLRIRPFFKGVKRAAPQRPSTRKQRVWRWIKRTFWGLAWLFILTSLFLVLALRWAPVPGSSVMTQHWIKAMWAGQSDALRYDWISYSKMSPHVALAVLAAEDQRFPHHWGVDFVELGKVLKHVREGRPTRGASTVTQQVAKNLFLWSGRSWIRKGLEIWFTVLLEGLWSKQRILEVYLNIAEFGEYTFGVEAASQRFFNKPAANLTASEAARLAAVLPNPLRYRVDKPSHYVLKRQRWIERQMRQLGGVTYLDKL